VININGTCMISNAIIKQLQLNYVNIKENKFSGNRTRIFSILSITKYIYK
jgi:hypothetical protein